MDNLTIRISPEKVINLPSLTEAQVRAITGKPCDFSIFVFIFCFDEVNGKAVLTAFLSHIKLQQFLIKPSIFLVWRVKQGIVLTAFLFHTCITLQ